MKIVVENVLKKEECDELINVAFKNLTQAGVLGEAIPGYRTAQNTWVFDKSKLTDKIKNIVVDKTGLPIENQEAIHIVRYEVGGEYKPHQDSFHKNTPYYEKVIKQGGQRVYSCLFYLNDEFLGGETHFPTLGVLVTPKIGNLLMWENSDKNGEVLKESLHAGLPVISGEKWIAIIWVRETAFN